MSHPPGAIASDEDRQSPSWQSQPHLPQKTSSLVVLLSKPYDDDKSTWVPQGGCPDPPSQSLPCS